MRFEKEGEAAKAAAKLAENKTELGGKLPAVVVLEGYTRASHYSPLGVRAPLRGFRFAMPSYHACTLDGGLPTYLQEVLFCLRACAAAYPVPQPLLRCSSNARADSMTESNNGRGKCGRSVAVESLVGTVLLRRWCATVGDAEAQYWKVIKEAQKDKKKGSKGGKGKGKGGKGGKGKVPFE